MCDVVVGCPPGAIDGGATLVFSDASNACGTSEDTSAISDVVVSDNGAGVIATLNAS